MSSSDEFLLNPTRENEKYSFQQMEVLVSSGLWCVSQLRAHHGSLGTLTSLEGVFHIWLRGLVSWGLRGREGGGGERKLALNKALLRALGSLPLPLPPPQPP